MIQPKYSIPQQDPHTNESIFSGGLSTPVLSTPKAGGAISSIGKKFAVNPSLGICSFSIHLPQTSTGAIDLGAITRLTKGCIPKYHDDDTYILSGADDLVPTLIYDSTSKT